MELFVPSGHFLSQADTISSERSGRSIIKEVEDPNKKMGSSATDNNTSNITGKNGFLLDPLGVH